MILKPPVKSSAPQALFPALRKSLNSTALQTSSVLPSDSWVAELTLVHDICTLKCAFSVCVKTKQKKKKRWRFKCLKLWNCERDQRRLTVFRSCIHTVLWHSLCLRWHISDKIVLPELFLSSEVSCKPVSTFPRNAFWKLEQDRVVNRTCITPSKQGYTKINFPLENSSLRFLRETTKDAGALLCAAGGHTGE